MSKKKKKNQKETTIEDFYDLKVDKVDELVEALKTNTVSEDDEPLSFNVADCVGEGAQYGEETEYKKTSKKFNPYKLDRLSRLPTWIKAFFIKFWFAGMVAYFINFGLTTVISSTENLLLLEGLILGIIVDIFVNPLFRYFQSDDKEYNNYIMFPFPFKQFWTLLTNMIYYIIVVLCISQIYAGINIAFNLVYDTTDYSYLGVEPLLFGVFAVLVDMVFIGIKDLVVFLVKKLKNKKKDKVSDV